MIFKKFTALMVVTIGLALPVHSAERPKLVVAILVDQLRYDYMERFNDQFVPGGFKLLTEQGTFMTFARYNYFPTVTGPGHASFLSGTTPASHGIIANDWFDKTKKKMLNCVDDSTVSGVGTERKSADSTSSDETASGTAETESSAGKKSPRNFIGANFADQLRLQYQSKVVGVSIKDRGAILPTGKKPAGAYWFEAATGNFITSTYYTDQLPEWVQAFNERKRAKDFIGQTWKRLLDPKMYAWDDAGAGEAPLPGERKNTFDHTITASPTSESYESIIPTPFGNQLVVELAQAAIEGEKLGQGPQPDLLTVSFSSIDACGHRFGPYSQEVQDITLRLDRQLAELFSFIDKKIGLSNVAIVLTADHGVSPLPEFATKQGMDGQRISEGTMVKDLQAKLSEKFGPGNYLLTGRIIEGNIYFDHNVLREKGIEPGAVASFIREWAFSTGKYQACYSREQILDGRTPGQIGERIFNGYNAERSGDVVLVYKPFTIQWGRTGTTHGSVYSYDTHVPVLFHGPAFKPGRYADEFYITDIVPTLCAALHMDVPPGSIGKPFTKALVE